MTGGENYSYFALHHNLHVSGLHNVETICPVPLYSNTKRLQLSMVIITSKLYSNTKIILENILPAWWCVLHQKTSSFLIHPQFSSSRITKRGRRAGERFDEEKQRQGGHISATCITVHLPLLTSRDFSRGTDSTNCSYSLLFLALFFTMSLRNVARSWWCHRQHRSRSHRQAG